MLRIWPRHRVGCERQCLHDGRHCVRELSHDRGALQTTLPTGSGFASYSSFVTKLKPDGSAILWSTYLGGNVASTFPGANIAFDANANALWISLLTGGGSNYPITIDASQKVHGGGASDAGIVQLDASSGALKYSTYLGGGADDAGLAIAIDSGGSVFLAGTTNSINFPTTGNAFQPTLTENAFDGTDWFFSVLGSGAIGSVRPARGGNNGGATLTVRGAGFQSDAVGSLLTSTGAVVASATAVDLAVGGSTTNFVFALDGVAPGSYDLRITNPDTSVITKSAAFVVEAGGTPALSVQIIGRLKIRTGVASTFQIVVSNTGSQDAYMAPLWVTAPNTISVSIDGLNVSAGSDWFAETGVNRFPTLIPFVKAGGSETLSMALTAPIDIANISINAALQAPWFRTATEVSAFAAAPTSDIGCIPNASNPYFINCAGLYFAYLSANKTPFTLTSASAPATTGLIKTLNTRAHPLGGTGCPTPPPPGDPGFLDGVNAGSKDRNSKPPGHTPNPWNGTGNNSAWNTWQAGYAAGYVAGGSSSGPGPTTAPLNVRALAACPPDPLPPPPPPLQPTGGGSSGSGGAIDPNDKAGPTGDGSTNHYIQAGIPMTYQVEFENQPTASLAAAQVVITDQLDATKLDLSTFTIGSISFGTHVINGAAGQSNYSTIFSIDASLSVRIQGSLNPTTGLAKWTFTTLDPATGLPPSDPTLGFLPPDTDGIKGQGQVTYSIRQKAGLADGAVIINQASIVFDANPAIATPIWTNVIDTTPPVGKVQSIVPKVGRTSFDVNWSTTGTGSAGRTYTLYVSDNGAAFTRWLTQVSSTSATYAGTSGHTYGFYVIATDGAGNMNLPKTAAEASITVSENGSAGGGSGGGGGCSMASRVNSLDPAFLALVGFALVMRRRSRR